MPDSIGLTLAQRPVPIDVSFDGGAFRLFTDGKLPYSAWPRGTFRLRLVDSLSSRTDVEATANYGLFFRIEKVP